MHSYLDYKFQQLIKGTSLTSGICDNIEFCLGSEKAKEDNFKMPTKSKEEIDDLFCCCFWQIYIAVKNLFCNHLAHVVDIRLFSQNPLCLQEALKIFYLNKGYC